MSASIAEKGLEDKRPGVKSFLNDRKKVLLLVRTIVHLLELAHHLVGNFFGTVLLISVMGHEVEKIREIYDYAYGFGTNWNFCFQTTFLFLAVSHDVLEWGDRHGSRLGQLVRYWRDVVFSGLVVPTTMFVTGMFWSIYSIDRELVFPKIYDDIVPWWFNHCVHTNIVVIVCLETLLQARRRPVDVKVENICVITVLISYAVVYYSIYFVSHRWLYQVFGVMNWWQICLFQFGIWITTYSYYKLQYPINRLIHGADDEEVKGQSNGEVIYNTEVSQAKLDGRNGDLVTANGNGVNTQVNTNGEEEGRVDDGGKEVMYKNGTMERKSSLNKTPFSDRSWSLKYRTIRNQFENSSL